MKLSKIWCNHGEDSPNFKLRSTPNQQFFITSRQIEPNFMFTVGQPLINFTCWSYPSQRPSFYAAFIGISTCVVQTAALFLCATQSWGEISARTVPWNESALCDEGVYCFCTTKSCPPPPSELCLSIDHTCKWRWRDEYSLGRLGLGTPLRRIVGWTVFVAQKFQLLIASLRRIWLAS